MKARLDINPGTGSRPFLCISDMEEGVDQLHLFIHNVTPEQLHALGDKLAALKAPQCPLLIQDLAS